jgi:predicted RNA methylase
MDPFLFFLLFFLVYIWFKLLVAEAIFIPLPMSTVRKMLRLARIRRDDVLYDLGAGDGRVIITAAKDYGCEVVGIERSRLIAALCKWNIKRSGLNNRIKLLEKNYFDVNLSKATVVTAYLSQRQNNMLAPKLKKELRKGARIISASHTFPGLREVRKIRTGHFYTRLYKI